MMQDKPLEEFLTAADPRALALGLGAVLALIGTLLGLSLAVLGPLITVILLAALAVGAWALAGLENALWGVIAVIAFLPYGTLPFKIVITPTFLDMALAVFLFLYLMQWMTGERRRLITTPVHPLIVLFIVLAVFSFVAGLRYAGLTSTVLRRFAELVLSMSLSLVIVDVLRGVNVLKRLVRVILITGVAAALLAIALWLIPSRQTEAILTRLSVIGYPAAGAVQYIESNPELPERLIGTGVNPNSTGGYLVMLAALAAPQLVSQHPLLRRRWLSYLLWLVLLTALVLTFSRGAMLALGVALFLIALVRYRRLLVVMALIAALILALPWTQVYVQRMIEGFQGADLATQMRFGEYFDALKLIQRYPLLGVGFSGTPDIDIYLGVANVYLTIASNMGLLGLSVFLLTMAGVFLYGWGARHRSKAVPGLYPIWLGSLAALAGVLANGVFDHYYFNLEFHHIVTLFWIYVGIALAASRMGYEADPDGLVRAEGERPRTFEPQPANPDP